MDRRKLYVWAFFMLFSLTLSAKVNVDIEVMPQFTDRFSWAAGINLEIPVSGKLYLLPGIGYSLRHRFNHSSMESYHHYPEGDELTSYEKVTMDVKGHYIQIPLLIGYKAYVGSVYTIKVAGGVYYAYGIGGNSKLKTDENGDVSEMSFPSFKTTLAHRSDYGLCVEVKCLLYGHYQVGLNLQHGLRKIYDGMDVMNANQFWVHRLGPGVQFHQSIALSVGYLF